jgi:hypothetical protein
MNAAAETLISELMNDRGMSREEAVTAVVTVDKRERYFGRAPLAVGQPLSVIYAHEMQGELTEEQAVRVVAYLRGVSEEVARADLMERISEGSVHFETKH